MRTFANSSSHHRRHRVVRDKPQSPMGVFPILSMATYYYVHCRCVRKKHSHVGWDMVDCPHFLSNGESTMEAGFPRLIGLNLNRSTTWKHARPDPMVNRRKTQPNNKQYPIKLELSCLKVSTNGWIYDSVISGQLQIRSKIKKKTQIRLQIEPLTDALFCRVCIPLKSQNPGRDFYISFHETEKKHVSWNESAQNGDMIHRVVGTWIDLVPITRNMRVAWHMSIPPVFFMQDINSSSFFQRRWPKDPLETEWGLLRCCQNELVRHNWLNASVIISGVLIAPPFRNLSCFRGNFSGTHPLIFGQKPSQKTARSHGEGGGIGDWKMARWDREWACRQPVVDKMDTWLHDY